MKIPWDMVVTVIVAIFASNGFWDYLKTKNKKKKKDPLQDMVLGIDYIELINACTKYLDRGYITAEELHDLDKYLFTPYTELGGDSTAKTMFENVKSLPIKSVSEIGGTNED